jgi:hypothetical protein
VGGGLVVGVGLGVAGSTENKANSAQLELELGLSLLKRKTINKLGQSCAKLRLSLVS